MENIFKPNDRVVLINDSQYYKYHFVFKGDTGTVTKVAGTYVTVHFDGNNINKVDVNMKDITLYTPKFKTGDRVELLSEPYDNIRTGNQLKPGMTGTICNTHDNTITVEWDNFNGGWSSINSTNKYNKWCVHKNRCKKIKPQDITKTEPKFKFDIGDIVKTNTGFTSSADGKIGKIINISKGISGKTIYLVEFYESSTCFHDGNVEDNVLIKGNKTGKDKHCYYLRESALVKCDKEQKFKFDIGDRVMVYDCLLNHHNKEGKIINVCETSEGKLLYLVELDFAEPYRLHNGYNTNLKILAGAERGKENQCYYAREDALCLLCKAGEKEVMFAM